MAMRVMPRKNLLQNSEAVSSLQVLGFEPIPEEATCRLHSILVERYLKMTSDLFFQQRLRVRGRLNMFRAFRKWKIAFHPNTEVFKQAGQMKLPGLFG
jgi:hypothetical protein